MYRVKPDGAIVEMSTNVKMPNMHPPSLSLSLFLSQTPPPTHTHTQSLIKKVFQHLSATLAKDFGMSYFETNCVYDSLCVRSDLKRKYTGL